MEISNDSEEGLEFCGGSCNPGEPVFTREGEKFWLQTGSGHHILDYEDGVMTIKGQTVTIELDLNNKTIHIDD